MKSPTWVINWSLFSEQLQLSPASYLDKGSNVNTNLNIQNNYYLMQNLISPLSHSNDNKRAPN